MYADLRTLQNLYFKQGSKSNGCKSNRCAC